MILTKWHASTGNRTRNNSLEGCYANHYTIDALGDLLIFEARNYIFKSKIQIQKELASSGNRNWAASVVGEQSTTEPTMLTCYGSFRSHVRPEFTLKIMILTKWHASTGNRTRNNSLEGCYANHYTIDALGDLLIFEATNYIFKSKIQIQKELASSGNPTRAESNHTDCLYCGWNRAKHNGEGNSRTLSTEPCGLFVIRVTSWLCKRCLISGKSS